MTRLICLAAAAMYVVGCTTAGATGFLQGVNGARAAQTATAEFLVFGGDNHDVFLGCLTCSRYDVNAIGNQYGQHGNPYAIYSVLNKFGDYGSLYSIYSMCNPYTLTPPVLVDRAGNFYGALTMNRYHVQRTRITSILRWVAAACAA